MRCEPVVVSAICLAFCLVSANAQTSAIGETSGIALTVPTGAPLRLYLTGRVPKRAGTAVEARVLEAVYAYDREVIPAGTLLRGEVVRTEPVSRRLRVTAMVNGDFTPLRQAEVEFNKLTLPDDRELATHTLESVGLNSIYAGPSKHSGKTQNQNGGILGTAKQTVRDRINAVIDSRSRGLAGVVRGPNKKEKLIDLIWSKLPYHPQYIRRGTRFDAALREPLEFGSVPISPSDLVLVGTQPNADSVVHARLLTGLNSASATPGATVTAVVTIPLFSPDQKLVIPQGTMLKGTVLTARRAKSFHRPGQLRFSFQQIDLPQLSTGTTTAVQSPASMPTQGTLDAAEPSGTALIRIDSEGGVQAKESKTRFISPLISLLIAGRASDFDNDRHNTSSGSSGNANIGGRTIGGGSGFGLLGMAASQSSRWVGVAFGYYGLAWSVYRNVIARGGEVQFDRNAVVDIRFGTRTAHENSKPNGR